MNGMEPHIHGGGRRPGDIPGHYCSVAVLMLSVFAGSSTTVPAVPITNMPPNILVIVADDLGHGDLGFTGSSIKTPHLDRLAATGVRLTRFYACPVCSPTRAGLMTGRWPHRLGIMRTVIPPWCDYGLPATEKTLAEMLADGGYETRGMLGKWHLGHARKSMLPPQRGFTHFYGCYNGAADYFTRLRNGELDWHRDAETLREDGYTTELLGHEAARFLRDAPRNKPWFLYLAFTAPHAPYQARDADVAPYKGRQGDRRVYAGMVDCLDQNIGRTLAAIEDRGEADNTFILFFSDNGGHIPVARNTPWRDGKFSVHEGGIRVVAVARWPAGGISGGHTRDALMGYIDVYPTLKRIAGVDSTDPHPLDGCDMLDVLRGQMDAPERPWFSYIAPKEDEEAAIHDGPWKLVAKGRGLLTAKPSAATQWELYRLTDDPEEQNNLSTQYPEIVQRLRKLLVRFGAENREGVPAYAKPSQDFKAPKDWRITQ